MSILRISILSFALLLLVAAPRAHAQTADAIIAQHIEAMGGKEKLQSIKSIYMEGVAVMGNGTEINTKTWRVKDKLYRQEISFGMGNVVIIVTPTKGWSSNPRSGGEFKALPDSVVKMMGLQLDLTPLVDYAAKGGKVELLGNETVGDKACAKIKLTFAAGNYVTYFIDNQSHYVLRESRKGGGMIGGGGGGQGGGRRDPNAEFSIDFSDYQKTPDGYVFPNTIVAGGFGAKTSVEKLEINKAVDEEKLGKP
jgi:hypothetical protein